MSNEPVIVRAIADDAEAAAFFLLADQTFGMSATPESAKEWSLYVQGMEEFRPEQLRGAFRGATYAGGLILYERVLHAGVAQVPVGCIGAVVTQPDQRMQGVATALMHDAIASAQQHGLALLLLDGIPGFYHHYGYSDVFDLAEQSINRAAVLAQPAAEHSVRAATADDAQALRDCYERRFGSYTGSFTRSLRQQQHRLQRRTGKTPIWLAVSPTGAVEGYMLPSMRGFEELALQERMFEVGADSWPALLALAQFHAHLLDTHEQPTDLRWHLPPDSPEERWLIDGLRLPPPISTDDPQSQWTVRTDIYHAGNAAWMARLTSIAALTQSMLPEWQRRWQQSLAHWQGAITLNVDGAGFTLIFVDDQIQLATTAPGDAIAVELTAQQLVQLVFGYRPVSWVATQPGSGIAPAALAPLAVLFDSGIPWIPASDGF